ncbi:alpha/beta-hydrolase [Ganoderma leucocontextum]|nr:alpha/beta-hydrolase [Ganoderma leucocontextum]
MDDLDRKAEQVRVYHTVVPPGGQFQDERPARRRLSRGARILLLVGTAAVTVGLHVFKDRLYASDYPEVLVHPAPATMSMEGGPEFDWQSLEPSTEINWAPCYDGQQCARLLLPLDYLSDDPSGATTAIALRMIPARDRTNYRGAVLINPGGPGGSGTELVARRGQNISTIVGDSFDVLGFDPRGVGASTPRLDCFSSKSQRDIWYTQEGHQFLNASDEGVLGLYKARQRLVGDRCAESDGGEEGIARFMSTASVATDMLRITEKLGQEKLHYWGFSYGSILGQYFAAMYPDKVGRVIIDGVYDAENYRSALWNSNLLDNEAVIDSLFTYCHQAGPLKCALYEPTPSAIRDRYNRVLSAVERDPVPVSLAEPPVLLTRKMLVAQIFSAAYSPLVAYPAVISTIRAIETNNQTVLAALAQLAHPVPTCDCARSPRSPSLLENDAFYAIACGDGDARTFDRAAYQAFYGELTRDAPTAGPIWATYHLGCTQWPVRPRWRYTGALAARTTSHPLLVVQPRYDPVCPLRDARAARARYGGAGLLVQNSYGHCSLSAPSVCTAKHVRAYMEQGTLPAEGTVCEPDEVPFVGRVSDVRARSAEDERLLDALRGLSEVVPMFPGV